jgi:hypothetical protein
MIAARLSVVLVDQGSEVLAGPASSANNKLTGHVCSDIAVWTKPRRNL